LKLWHQTKEQKALGWVKIKKYCALQYMSETVYIETSILGYLTARPSRNLVLVANTEVTREWWDMRRRAFNLYTSQAVVKEVSQGDAEIASQRLAILRDFPLLELNQSVLDLAEQFLGRSNLPSKADVDAIHIAAATVHGMDYLLTWNCKHIANAQIQGKLAEISLDFGYELPILCTPYELLEG
jgi:predicted nucleic acid-binding protein